MSEVIEELSQNKPKQMPLFFSQDTNRTVVSLSQSESVEVNGFSEKQKHQELVNHMLDNCVSKIVTDIRTNPPKRYRL